MWVHCVVDAPAVIGQHRAKVGILDLDICGPSIPKMMAVEEMGVVNTQYGWIPLK